ncbi:hypothetical protein [Alkalibacterium sp. MB6]|uniref:hypothetical protein n=1 Tax=Alkalibacterium sp. MB6 TaxID=2081965 RepID=UPI001F474BD1|nr:hypothetical protein [Alkalibacterium sp. MB6]
MMTIHLIYGGISAEHDVSVRSASSFISGVNFFSYSVALLYITKDGQWRRWDYSRLVRSD